LAAKRGFARKTLLSGCHRTEKEKAENDRGYPALRKYTRSLYFQCFAGS